VVVLVVVSLGVESLSSKPKGSGLRRRQSRRRLEEGLRWRWDVSVTEGETGPGHVAVAERSAVLGGVAVAVAVGRASVMSSRRPRAVGVAVGHQACRAGSGAIGGLTVALKVTVLVAAAVGTEVLLRSRWVRLL